MWRKRLFRVGLLLIAALAVVELLLAAARGVILLLSSPFGALVGIALVWGFWRRCGYRL
jgi:hypothetical protein